MGMSASQARLLTITARLTSNEYESQFLTNSKMRLSSKTQEASDEYIQALNSKKYQFNYYNTSGEEQDYDLTANYLYTYADLKNQYQIRKASGVNLVSRTDAENYENTDTLVDFLKCYNLIDDESGYEEKLAAYNYEYEAWEKTCESLTDTYNKELETYNTTTYPNYKTQQEQYTKDLADYEVAYQKYLDDIDLDVYNKFVSVLGTDDDPHYCYMQVLEGTPSYECYIHVLDHLLDWQGGDVASTIDPETGSAYQSTIGNTVTPKSYQLVNSLMHVPAVDNNFKDVSDAVCKTSPADEVRYCDGYDYYSDDISERKGDTLYDKLVELKLDGVRANDLSASNLQLSYGLTSDQIRDLNALRLSSDYYVEDDGSMGLKTLKQKVIDLYDLVSNYTTTYNNINDDTMKQTLINFTEGDLKIIPDEPEAPIPPIEPAKPELVLPDEPEAPEYVFEINDKDKAQWYVNLWNLMNGSDSANVVYQKEDEDNVWPNEDEYWTVASPAKSQYASNYEVIEDNLLNSSEWLSNALKLGTVTLVKPQYSTSNINVGSANEQVKDRYYWEEISLSSSVDVTEVDDEEAIAKAEAVYQRKVDAISEQDDKYTQKIKRLDTEHTSLQTEYSSVQSEMNKNIERSYKTFSA